MRTPARPGGPYPSPPVVPAPVRRPVRRVPSPEEIARVENEIDGYASSPSTPGDRLSDRPGHDSYSYALAEIIVGAAPHPDELQDKYDRCSRGAAVRVRGPRGRRRGKGVA